MTMTDDRKLVPREPIWWRDPLQLALTFHNLYEQFAPRFGYETRTETRKFDPESANGQLMQTVCASIIAAIDAAPSPAAEPPQDYAGLCARLCADADAWLFHGGQQVQSCRTTADLECEAAAAIRALMQSDKEANEAWREACLRAAKAEAALAAARSLLLRWLQAHNQMSGREGLTIAQFDTLRQETHAAIDAARGAGKD